MCFWIWNARGWILADISNTVNSKPSALCQAHTHTHSHHFNNNFVSNRFQSDLKIILLIEFWMRKRERVKFRIFLWRLNVDFHPKIRFDYTKLMHFTSFVHIDFMGNRCCIVYGKLCDAVPNSIMSIAF